MTELLTTGEKETLVECEKIIERGQETFIEVGRALMKIRDKKLYRSQHDTFEAYCKKRWGWSRSYAHRVMGAAEVATKLLPTGNMTERVVRPLVTMEDSEQRQQAWDQANETAAEENRPVTSADVAKAASKVKALSKLVDTHGEVVPDDLVEEWTKAEELAKEAWRYSSALLKLVRDGITGKNIAFRELTNGMIAELDGKRFEIDQSLRPYCLCPTCHGMQRKKCTRCKGRGYIGKYLWNTTASMEERQMVGAVK